MNPVLSDIKASIDELARKIDAPANLLPEYEYYTCDGQPFIEIETGLLFYSAYERGQELYRYIARDKYDLMYHAFKDITFEMAINYEFRHRIKGQDFRRIVFEEQKRLFGILDEKWRLRKEKEQNELLISHPFSDNI